MHRAGLRTALVTLLVLSSLLVYSAAYAQTLTYVGETTDNSSYADNGVWDYVYLISGWNFMNLKVWAVVTAPSEGSILNHWEPPNWNYRWYSDIGDYGASTLSEVDDMPGIVWNYTSLEGSDSDTAVFGFTSNIGPGRLPYDGDGWSGKSTISNAAPEPASLALTALTLAGIAGWRRRRTAK